MAALPDRFPNPGLPAHKHRMADVDQGAEKRAERQVVMLFAISALGTLFAIVSYFVVAARGHLREHPGLHR